MKRLLLTDNLTAMSRPPKRNKPFAGQQIEQRRAQLGRKSGSTIEQETDGVIYQKLLQRIENGEKPLDSLTPKQLHALALALCWSVRDLQEATKVDLGAFIPTGWVQAGQHSGDDVTSSTRVRVPVYALAAAGVGTWTEDDVVTYIEVEPEIANRPNRVTFQVDGSSMEPTLEHGDFIHVDLADRDIRDDKVYVVLMLSNGVVVKRARVYEGGVIELVSDNKNHPSVRPDEARIIGRVCAVTPRTRRL